MEDTDRVITKIGMESQRLDDPDVPPTLRAETGPWQMCTIYANLSDFEIFDDHTKEDSSVNSKPVSIEIVGDKGQNYGPE